MYKQCGLCKQAKPIDEFHKDKKGGMGVASRCKFCANSESRRHHARKMQHVPSYVEAKRDHHFKTRYGITAAEYDKLCEEAHLTGCNICGTKQNKSGRWKDRWHLDHCHATNRLRGMLCGNCNRGLGQFQDNQEIMMKAIEYLKKHSEPSKEGSRP